jgi:hypothetical protein
MNDTATWRCMCCGAPDRLGPENGSGGLCTACNENECPRCHTDTDTE